MTDTEYTLASLSKSEIDYCINLWRDRMAEGYPDRLVLANAASSVTGYVGVVVKNPTQTVGFATGYVGTVAGVISIPYADIRTDWSLSPTQKAGYLDILCISENHEGCGNGTALAEETIRRLSQYDVPLLTEIWHREGVDGEDVVEKLGFERVLTGDNYWRKSTKGRGRCPECGESPCQCTGSLQISHQ